MGGVKYGKIKGGKGVEGRGGWGGRKGVKNGRIKGAKGMEGRKVRGREEYGGIKRAKGMEGGGGVGVWLMKGAKGVEGRVGSREQRQWKEGRWGGRGGGSMGRRRVQ